MSFRSVATNDAKSVETSSLATIVLAKLYDMKTRNLLAATSIPNPGMRDFQFLIYSRERYKVMNGIKNITRRLLASMRDRASKTVLTSRNAKDANFWLRSFGERLYMSGIIYVLHSDV